MGSRNAARAEEAVVFVLLNACFESGIRWSPLSSSVLISLSFTSFTQSARVKCSTEIEGQVTT